MPLLDLADDDLRLLNDALIQLPYWRVAPLIANLNRQLTAQRDPGGDDHDEHPEAVHETEAGD